MKIQFMEKGTDPYDSSGEFYLTFFSKYMAILNVVTTKNESVGTVL
jgi:hypothetical protein